MSIKGRRQKKKLVLLGGGGRWGGFEARPQLSAKKVPVFFLVPFDAETFKTCKYTKKNLFGCTTPSPLSTGAVNLSKVSVKGG